MQREVILTGLSLKTFAKFAVWVEFLAVHCHYSSVCVTLLNLHEETDNTVAASEILSLVQKMEQFKFIIIMVAWMIYIVRLYYLKLWIYQPIEIVKKL